MTTRFVVLAGVAVLALAGAGAGVASALNDLPQDAVPVRDPTSVLNTQPAVPPPPPVEPAPEGEPAPASPVAVTPPAPSIVIAEDDPIEIDPVEEKTEAAPPVKAVETPVEPSRRQRRRVAIVEAIDKITAESMRFEVEVGGRPVRFKRSLIFTARACEVSAPDEQVTDAVAYLEVAVQPRGILRSSDPRQIFRGWMFASSPAINGLEHPVYDAWVVGCKA
jgi:hypothetical protein